MTKTLTPPTIITTPPGPRRWSGWIQRLSAFASLVFVFALFTYLQPRSFPTPRNINTMLMQTTRVATAALGMTLVIVSGGIDLSVASTMALVTMVVATTLNLGAPPLAAALIGIATAAVCGLLIGLLVTQLRLLPFIVTLGTWSAYRGLAEVVGHENAINTASSWLNDLMEPQNGPFGIRVAPSIVITLVLSLFMAGMMRYTRFGRHVFAVGSNEQTARLCGVAVDRVKVLVYVTAGLLAGVAGVLQFSYISQGDPSTASGMELDVIAAVVIGGASLNGGQGSILGTLIGALIMAVLANGCTKMGWESGWQKIITGAIIVLAVTVDQLRHRGER